MSNKIIERRWKEGLFELVWTILSNNSVFLFSKNLFSKVFPNGCALKIGYGLENNLLHLSEEYIDYKSVFNISYNKKSLGMLWVGFPIERLLNGIME